MRKQKFWLVVVCWLILVPVANSSTLPVVEFSEVSTKAIERAAVIKVELNLSHASKKKVVVALSNGVGTASSRAECSGRDYRLLSKEVVFSPGQTKRHISYRIFDDRLGEADENVSVKLLQSTNASVGENSEHNLTIVDDDRQRFVSVRDFGAIGDGITDDSSSIQAAVDYAMERSAGVVLFPEGNYLVGDRIDIGPGLTLSGYGATLSRLPMQGKWENTLSQRHYSSDKNSKPLIIQGLHIDGNSAHQGPYRDYELQQAHLIFLAGNYGVEGKAGKLVSYLEDLSLTNGTGDGISIAGNVNARVCRLRARDVFRGAITMTHGNSILRAYDVVTGGLIDPTGIDIEIEGSGTVKVYMENVVLERGDFDVAMSKEGAALGGVFQGKNIRSYGSSFYLHSKLARVNISNSEFWIGAHSPPLGNTILQPGNVVFKHVDFVVTEEYENAGKLGPLEEKDRELFALDVLWNSKYETPLQNQKLVCFSCAFSVDGKTVESDDRVRVVRARGELLGQNNRLRLESPNVSPSFHETFSQSCASCAIRSSKRLRSQ